MRRLERPLAQLPIPVLLAFMLLLCLQLFTYELSARQAASKYKPLSLPFDAEIYRNLSMGSEKLLSYLLAIRLQLHDNQAGRHIRYSNLNYSSLVNWLEQIYRLNESSEYTMVLASRVYSQTKDKKRLRTILEYISQTYELNPQLHWRHMAEGSVIAKHHLEDLEFALAMAEKLSNQPESVSMPRWARDIHLLLFAELNEFESALIIIEALLQSGTIIDPDEIRFLKEKLLLFQQELSKIQQ